VTFYYIIYFYIVNYSTARTNATVLGNMFIPYISMISINYVEIYWPFFLFTLIAKFTFTSCRMISSAINTLIETVIQEL